MAYLTPGSSRHMSLTTSEASKLLTPFEVYIALVKGYCVILILIIPRAFVTGGYGSASILLFLSGVISTVCASLLVKSGLRANIHSYSELTGHVLGRTGKVLIDICISLAQYSFTVSHISFMLQSLQSTVNV